MQINHPIPMLAGLSPQEFMDKYWQKKPLLIKGAFKDFKPVLSRTELFKLAESEEVQSRLVEHQTINNQSKWVVKRGPIKGKDKPPFNKEAWTLLLQGVDLINAQAA